MHVLQGARFSDILPAAHPQSFFVETAHSETYKDESGGIHCLHYLSSPLRGQLHGVQAFHDYAMAYCELFQCQQHVPADQVSRIILGWQP